MLYTSVFILSINAYAVEIEPEITSYSEGIPVAANPFTPEGQGNILDNATANDNKEFFTFSTPDGNVFFIVVDRERHGNNVYLLNAVTEYDLLSFVEDFEHPVQNSMGGIPVSPTPIVPEIPTTEEPPPIEPTPTTPAKGNGNNTTLFLLIAVIVLGGVGYYYFKILRPKQQDGNDDFEDGEQDLGEEMEFETASDDDDENAADSVEQGGNQP